MPSSFEFDLDHCSNKRLFHEQTRILHDAHRTPDCCVDARIRSRPHPCCVKSAMIGSIILLNLLLLKPVAYSHSATVRVQGAVILFFRVGTT